MAIHTQWEKDTMAMVARARILKTNLFLHITAALWLLVQHNQFRLLAAYLLMLYLIKMEVLAAAGNLLARAMVYLNIRLAILLIRYGMESPIAAVVVLAANKSDQVRLHLNILLGVKEVPTVEMVVLIEGLQTVEGQAVFMVVEVVAKLLAKEVMLLIMVQVLVVVATINIITKMPNKKKAAAAIKA